MEPGVQTPDFTLRSGIGSCRDSAWLLVSILRQFGLAARFVSGYLVQLASDIEALDGPSGPAADFTDLHAWTEVYIPGAGWIGLDPTSGLFAGEGHIPLAATAHPATAAPITGGTGALRVRPWSSPTPSPASTKTRASRCPTPTRRGRRSATSASRVDERLAAGDVRLTVGGEPTFVSVDNQVDEEWTTAADGPHKRERASDLAARLKSVWAPQGLIHRGQGRWYPGEPLPRWQIALYWRTDGRPLWTDDALLADPWASRAAPAQQRADEAAYQLLAGVAEGLGLPPLPSAAGLRGPAVPAGRQSPHARKATRWNRATTSPDRTPPPGRDALLARLDESTTAPAAFVLPLHRRDDDGGWASANWRLRRGRIVLVEGDSPGGSAAAAGLRSAGNRRGPHSWSTRATVADALADAPDTEDAVLDDSETAPPTAMVAEVRDGLLYIFLPPTEALEHFVDLIARVEAAAAKADCPVVIEGYGPPPDPRLQSTTITPDPGVIEVNIAPAASFAEQTQLLETLYEQARLARLSTESFDFDGTHGGTGGGNHITLGGVTPADSPLLRRPDLLVSLLTYWQRHPSLSYLFAGRFVGTTSQAPRVDEGRARSALRTRDRVCRDRAADFVFQGRCRTTLGDRPRAAAPAHRHHRQHPSRRVLHRQALQPRQPARQARPAGAARASRCRRTCAWRWCSRCWCAPWWRGSGTNRCAPR